MVHSVLHNLKHCLSTAVRINTDQQPPGCWFKKIKNILRHDMASFLHSIGSFLNMYRRSWGEVDFQQANNQRLLHDLCHLLYLTSVHFRFIKSVFAGEWRQQYYLSQPSDNLETESRFSFQWGFDVTVKRVVVQEMLSMPNHKIALPLMMSWICTNPQKPHALIATENRLQRKGERDRQRERELWGEQESHVRKVNIQTN